MRKLKLQVPLSVDGFIAGPNSEMDCTRDFIFIPNFVF